ncbi:hypothetical protein [Actinomadura algeriensis]|uniref:PfkB family carbohydrate kinase n=1 Tax=Actinomadura algeriensis TaxID=1679523 RepID=A0ABR9JJP6_9ACTN|nr:hypothetical protein [Actinomadura algeriensis]MBE1530370.1 hypothetical protein [Actinomadura algeriensis]
MTDDPKIVCAGTLSYITCYNIASLPPCGYGEHAHTTALLGNDAVIAARLLHAASEQVSCLLLDPTEGDIDALRQATPGMEVRAAGRRPGPVTRSAALQDAAGQRYWLLPPTPAAPKPPFPPPAAAEALLYIDLYDELEEPVLALLAEWAPNRLIINLSGSRHSAKSARLAALRPLLVQASLPNAAAPAALTGAARKLRSTAHASYALVSAGSCGFTLAGADGTWLRTPVRIVSGAALGAGAALAAGALASLAHGIGGAELADAAARGAAAYLAGTGGGGP